MALTGIGRLVSLAITLATLGSWTSEASGGLLVSASHSSVEALDRIRRALAVRPSARVEQHRESIRTLVAEHHAVSPRIFGSVARGDDEPGSDVDLLVNFTDEASLLDEIGLRLELADLLQVDVDVVAADSLKGRVLERVLREAVEV